ncbi:hypothetical protein RSP799_19440 [Ralstonia solanacearum]|nr:hypothetical protein RSP799_19440 [Ralstonia solanacearum]
MAVQECRQLRIFFPSWRIRRSPAFWYRDVAQAGQLSDLDHWRRVVQLHRLRHQRSRHVGKMLPTRPYRSLDSIVHDYAVETLSFLLHHI